MTVVLEAIVGSTAYGLATPESDVDKIGIFVLPTAEFSRLRPPLDTEFSIVTHEPDLTLHELGKFCRLALQSNPTILELLWTPESFVTHQSEVGRELRSKRQWFASKELVKNAYLGYATQQFKRMAEHKGPGKQKRKEKNARHLLRLLDQGYQLYKTGELDIVVKDAKFYHEFGAEIAQNPQKAERYLRGMTELFSTTTSRLPIDPFNVTVDLWLRSVRNKF